MSLDALDSATLRAKDVVVPDYVVFRAFPAETIILNLKTGKYHGVNVTGGRMLETLRDAATVGEAVDRLAEEFGVEVDRIDADVRSLLDGLVERELVEIRDPGR